MVPASELAVVHACAHMLCCAALRFNSACEHALGHHGVTHFPCCPQAWSSTRLCCQAAPMALCRRSRCPQPRCTASGTLTWLHTGAQRAQGTVGRAVKCCGLGNAWAINATQVLDTNEQDQYSVPEPNPWPTGYQLPLAFSHPPLFSHGPGLTSRKCRLSWPMAIS